MRHSCRRAERGKVTFDFPKAAKSLIPTTQTCSRNCCMPIPAHLNALCLSTAISKGVTGC